MGEITRSGATKMNQTCTRFQKWEMVAIGDLIVKCANFQKFHKSQKNVVATDLKTKKVKILTYVAILTYK